MTHLESLAAEGRPGYAGLLADLPRLRAEARAAALAGPDPPAGRVRSDPRTGGRAGLPGWLRRTEVDPALKAAVRACPDRKRRPGCCSATSSSAPTWRSPARRGGAGGGPRRPVRTGPNRLVSRSSEPGPRRVPSSPAAADRWLRPGNR